jgi:hypothetical protein
LLQQALGGVVIAEQLKAGRRIPEAMPRPSANRRCRGSTSRSRAGAIIVVEQVPDLGAVLFAEREHEHCGALRSGELLARLQTFALAARKRCNELFDLGGRKFFCAAAMMSQFSPVSLTRRFRAASRG